MITQILGVALISLLTITPTIQQNNIEQLIAPNIEIQPMLMTTPDPNRLLVVNQFSYYYNDSISTFVANSLRTNFSSITLTGYAADWTYYNTTIGLLMINDNNLYVHKSGGSDSYWTSNVIRSVLREYYFKTRGSYPTSDSFSFSVSGSVINAQTAAYTYTLNGSQGAVSGRIYIRASLSSITTNLTNNIVNIPVGSTLQNVISEINPTIQGLETDEVIAYYYLGNSLNLTSQNQLVTNLNARTIFDRVINFGQVTINVNPPDTTPPTITSINGNSTNWTNQDVTLIVQATDNVGLNSLAYSFDNGATYQASNQATFTTNQIVNVRVRDTSNNNVLQEVIINRIDKQSPAILLAGNWKNTFELGELANNQALLNYLSISDGASGLNNGLTSITNFNYNQAGTYSNVQVSATDNAGNNFVYTLPTVNIVQPTDNTGPIITGPTIVSRTEGNITTQSILDLYSISDISGVEPNTISIRDLNNNIITNWSLYTEGSYQLRVYARDTLNNITQYQFTLQVGEAPPPDLTPPTIVGPLLVSFEIGTYTTNTEILNLYTFSDNVGIIQNQVIGEINYSELGDYQVTIRSTDTSNNVTNRNIVVRIRDEVVLGNYNPLTDLLSGIFGGALSMIFTIGTINILGLRLLDAMGVIILGAVLLFVYKAIKGGA